MSRFVWFYEINLQWLDSVRYRIHDRINKINAKRRWISSQFIRWLSLNRTIIG